jgi:hypothetical protein
MVFSEGELICFNSLLDGKRIFGTHFIIPQQDRKPFVDKTVTELREHKLLDENNKPNRSFLLVTKTLEEYKNADKYLIINRVKIGLIKDKKYVICLARTKKGYELTAVGKEMLIYNLMLNNNFLSKQVKEEEEKAILVDNDTWVREVKGNSIENLLCIQCVENKKYKDMAFLYSKGEMGFIYDPIKGVLKQWTYVSIVDTNNRTFLCRQSCNIFTLLRSDITNATVNSFSITIANVFR